MRHPELFEKWASIGLKQVFVGMEDCSDERLAKMKKGGVTVAQQIEAVSILRRIGGVMMYASFMIDPEYTREDFVALKKYIRQLKLNYATFTVMPPPLPGTELYTENKERLLSLKPELYDMLHTLFPTKLPMEEFYKELGKLWSEAVPLHRTMPVMLKYGLRGLILRFSLFGKFLKKVHSAHLDY